MTRARDRERQLLAQLTELEARLKKCEGTGGYWKPGMCKTLAQCASATHHRDQDRQTIADLEAYVVELRNEQAEGDE